MTENINLTDLVAERIKSSELGQIIKEEDLYDITKDAIDRAFFEPRLEGREYHKEHKPPLIVEVMSERLKASVEEAVDKYLVINADKMAEHMKTILEANVEAWVEDRKQERLRRMVDEAMGALYQQQMDLEKRLRNAGVNV